MTNRYYGPNWQEQREKALKDADYSCVSCGVDEGDDKQYYDDVSLHVHHKIPLRVFEGQFESVPWEVANHVKNLIALCPSCHAITDDQDNHVVPRGIRLSGEVRDEYHKMKPYNMTHNEFVEKLMENTTIENGVSNDSQDEFDKQSAYRELQHDMREMVRSELEQFGRKYLK